MSVTARSFTLACLVPLAIFTLAFLALPLARLLLGSADSEAGWGIYLQILQTPRYLSTLLQTVLVSLAVTVAALAISTTAGLFLARNRFRGRDTLVSILTLPLAFPGVVVGFMIILLGGRQGLFNQLLPGHIVFAYSIFGLFLGYLYFSIPRVLLTVMAAAEKIDPALEEAARTLGAPSHRVVIDVILPALAPAMIAAGAIAFATAMGAFGTAFTLATDIDVLPMVIYTEFTLSANFAMASALSVVLGLVTWAMLLIARMFSGTTVAAGG
ncbi:ABC transporter permease [Celeribacter sp. SCSIO 80788]|uniref:ABC transporter permease n=1 Tax=Celeribacter sp. SCSIO 80788 TaxID=3117013 RepID=UPI003DA55A7B